MKKYTIFETFVGEGGSHLGFKENFKSIYVNDISVDCLKTLKYNNKDLELEKTYIDNRSIIDIDPQKLRKKLSIEKGAIDVIFGGIVCKGFSLAGERNPNDERNYFYHKQLSIVKEFEPKISIIENVIGILNAKVISNDVEEEIKDKINILWKKIENFKGKKSFLRKENKLNNEVEKEGKILKEERKNILNYLEKEKNLFQLLKI